MPWGEGSEGWGVGTRGPCQGDGGEGGRQSRRRDLVVRLLNAGAAPPGSPFAGMTQWCAQE